MTTRKKNSIKAKIDVNSISAPFKVNYDMLSPDEKINWINIDHAEKNLDAGIITRIRPNFTEGTHLVCHYNPQDGKYDICYEVPNGS